MLELALFALLSLHATDEPALQAASPFYLRLTKTAAGFDLALLNRSQKAQAYLYDPMRQPFEPVLVDARGKACSLLDARAMASSDGRVWKKLYRHLDAQVETVLAQASISGSAVDRFTLRAPPFECSYLAAGKYKLSFLWRSKIRACDDCTAAEKKELSKVWLGVIRSNELEVMLQ